MADKKISQLTAATTPLAGTEVLPIVQGGSTVKVSAADVTTGRAVSAASLTLTGSPLGAASGGTGLASFTSGGVVYASSASALATGGALKWDGANKLTLLRTTATEAEEPTVEFSNKTFAGQNSGVVKGSNGGLALDIQSPSDSTFQARSRIYMNGGGTSAIIFSQSADNGATYTERAVLNAGGELITGGTTDQGAYNLQCNGTGVWGAAAYVNGSDARLKENIESLDSCLDVVKALRPVTFTYKEDYNKDRNVHPGFIAQELQIAMAGKPYLDGIVQAGTTHLNVAYQSLIPILVKAIQELEAKVAALESK
jgi:hypothetical protein